MAVAKKEIDEIELCRRLQLVHDNSIAFNEGSVVLESTTKLLITFITALWEEMIDSPYDHKVLAELKNGDHENDRDKFLVEKNNKRKIRYQFVKEEQLNIRELTYLSSKLEKLMEGPSLIDEANFSKVKKRLQRTMQTINELVEKEPTVEELRAEIREDLREELK